MNPSPRWAHANHQAPAGSPLTSIWSSTFTIPAKTVRNTQSNKRSWSKRLLSPNDSGMKRELTKSATLVWLAPWSTWSFTVRLTLMLSDKLRPEDPYLPPSLVATEIYDLNYKMGVSSDFPDVTSLPSLSHALYLFNTVKFHLGQTYRLYDEEEFEQQIRDFYPNALQRATECPLWFSKFLLTMAFGTAFHTPPKDSRDPPGGKFFIRAMALMPEPNSIWKDSFLGMEVLALAGLYLYSVDQREGANSFVSTYPKIVSCVGSTLHLC